MKNRNPKTIDPPQRYETAICQSAFEAIYRRAGWTLVVYFRKRTTGRMRRMVCLYNPERADKAPFDFNPVEKNLLAVWDLEKAAKRMIPLDAVKEIKAGGERVWPKHDLPQTFQEADAEMKRLFG